MSDNAYARPVRSSTKIFCLAYFSAQVQFGRSVAGVIEALVGQAQLWKQVKIVFLAQWLAHAEQVVHLAQLDGLAGCVPQPAWPISVISL